MCVVHISCTCTIIPIVKIYYTCSTAKFNNYKDYYFEIRNYLVSLGHTLTRDWLSHTAKMLKYGQTDMKDIKNIYQDCLKAIKDADLVIIEDTISNFSTGHQITLALQQRKPTLVLWQGQKYRQFKQMFIHGIDSDILQVAQVSNKDFQNIIKTFIARFENIDEPNRFHLVLKSPERQYLDWAGHKNKMSRTKIIRKALREMIDKDSDYTRYLSQD